MRGRISGKGKQRDSRGTGTGAEYKPWIHTREVSSSGTKSLIVDWKHGRQIHTLSRNETYWYYLLRWDDDVLDINEQYPLERSRTENIARALSVTHPLMFNDPDECMTTDFLVTYKDESRKAYSVKDRYEQVFGNVEKPEVKRLVEKQSIEMSYWKLQGVDFRIIFGDRDINRVLARNIALITNHYNIKNVHSIYEFTCYLLAHKLIEVPMDENPVDIMEVTHMYLADSSKVKHWLSVASENDKLLGSDKTGFEKRILANIATAYIPDILI